MRFEITFLRVIPVKPIRTHQNSFLKVMLGNTCTLPYSLGNYAEKSLYIFTPIRKLCQEIPVHFRTHLKVMPGNTCTLSHELSFERNAGKTCTLSPKSFLE